VVGESFLSGTQRFHIFIVAMGNDEAVCYSFQFLSEVHVGILQLQHLRLQNGKNTMTSTITASNLLQLKPLVFRASPLSLF